MASGRHRNIRQALEEILLCPMCMERLEDPKLLNCQHSACLKCLSKWYQPSSGKENSITCHQCRRLTFLPSEGLNALPGDFNKNILLDILDTAVDAGCFGSNRSYCTVCDITGTAGVGAKTPASAFCTNCKDHLCAPCLEEHNEHPLLEEHTIVVTPHGSHLSVLMCRQHRNKSMDFFCHDCYKLICSICIRTAHRDHLVEGADDVSEHRKRDILRHKQFICARLLKLKSECKSFNIDRRVSARSRLASFTAQRRSSFDVVSARATLESFVQFCDYLLKQADPGEVVAAADQVKKRADILLAETAQDEFTDRIIAMLSRMKPDVQVGAKSNPRAAGGAGSLTSDDRSSLTDDASFIGSDPGGVVTDLEENIEEEPEDIQRSNQFVEAVIKSATTDTKGKDAKTQDSDKCGPSHEDVDDVFKNGELEAMSELSIIKEFPTNACNGSPSLVWRCSDNGQEEGQIDGPWDLSFTPERNVVTTESVNNRVQLFSNNGRDVKVLMDGFEPRGVTVSNDGLVAVVDHTSKCVRLLPHGGSTKDVVRWKPENVANPEVLAFAPNGHRVVTDAGKHIVAVFDAEGQFLHSFGERGVNNGQFRQPLYVTVSSKGKVIVGDVHNNRIQAFTLDGKYLGKAGKKGAGDGNLNFPRGVCCDGTDNVIVSDSKNSRVTVFDHEGRWMRHLLTEEDGIKKTRGICVMKSDETLLAVSDRENDNSSVSVWSIS